MQKIVFNGHYLTYIDTAIAEYWREIGLPYPAWLCRALRERRLTCARPPSSTSGSARYDDELDASAAASRSSGAAA